MICTRCRRTGFLNLEQLEDVEPLLVRALLGASARQVARWVEAGASGTDVQVCDCCGNGETWYGERGQHDEGEAPETYDYNGGRPECY